VSRIINKLQKNHAALNKALGSRPGSWVWKQQQARKKTGETIPTQEFGKRAWTWKNLKLGWHEISIRTKIKVIFLLGGIIGFFAFAVWWIIFWI